MREIKKLIWMLLIAIFIGIGMSPKVFAVSYKDMGKKIGVEVNKTWVVKFNVDVDKASINTKNILVLDENNKETSIKVTCKDSRTIMITPSKNYEYNKTYTLLIKEGVKSHIGRGIKNSARLVFTTKKDVVKPTSKYIVALDPGRASNDEGYEVGPSGIKGKDINLSVALKTGKILENSGIQVVYTRTTDNVSWKPQDSVYSRSKIVNDSKASVFLSIHCNSYADINTTGSESYYLQGNSFSKELAQNVQEELYKSTKLPNRGIKSSNLKTLSEVNVPGAYVDLGFITNPTEEKTLYSEEYQQNSAEALSNAILKYLNKEGGLIPPKPPVVQEKIKLVKDIKVKAIQNENYNLPKTVTAITESNKEIQAEVIWDVPFVDTKLIGTMTIKGEVENYSKKVILTVVVYPKTDGSGTTGKKYKVAIDPGHGGYDSGAVGPTGVMEKNVTLAVGLKVGKILSDKGIEVIYTRTSDKCPWPSNKNIELQTRCDIANNAKADCFVSIHCNSADATGATGIETYYDRNKTNGIPLAKNIQNELINEFGAKNRGIKSSGLYVVKNTYMPAVLVELEFISNSEKEKILNSSAYQDRYAEAIAKGIIKTMGI